MALRGFSRLQPRSALDNILVSVNLRSKTTASTRKTCPLIRNQKEATLKGLERRKLTMSAGQGCAEQSITPIEESKRFMIDCLVAVGTPKDKAEIVAANLIAADYRGHFSHGMNRLEMYCREVRNGVCDAKANPTIEKETGATALVNGNNGLGAVIGKFCMDLAIKKAKEVGIGLVVAKRSNHYGIAGMYALQAMAEDCIGISMTNTSPLVAPTRAKSAGLGTNPIACGANALNGDDFVLDMATSAVAVGKIELQARKGIPLPKGWALNEDGQIETDPLTAFNAARLMPLGGPEENSGYKGSGLSMMVDLLCGVLGGATFGPNIRRWGQGDREADLGQMFMAINPKMFIEGFEGRVQHFIDDIRKIDPADPNKQVMVAGEPERKHMKKVDEEGGLKYVQQQLESNLKLAEELKVKPMMSV